MSDNDIGKKIFQRRKALKLTLEEVGRAVGVGKSTVQRWENGQIRNMGRDKIAALADILQMNPIEFVPGPEPMKKIYVRRPLNKKSFTNAVVKAIVNRPIENEEIRLIETTTRFQYEDPQTRSMMKLWEVSSPDARDAAIGVLKALNKPTKK